MGQFALCWKSLRELQGAHRDRCDGNLYLLRIVHNEGQDDRFGSGWCNVSAISTEERAAVSHLLTPFLLGTQQSWLYL